MNLEQAEKFRKQKHVDLKASGVATSDGCTLAPELGTPCCEMHDYLRRFQPIDPSTFRPITPREADRLLRVCIQKKGFPILAWVYWAIVRMANILGIYR